MVDQLVGAQVVDQVAGAQVVDQVAGAQVVVNKVAGAQMVDQVIIIIIYTTYIAPYIWPVWPFIGAEEGPSKY